MIPTLRKYGDYLLRFRSALAAGFTAMVFTNLFSVAKPMVLKTVIDDLEKEFDYRRILLLAGFIIILALFQGVFRFFQRWYLNRASRKAEFCLRNDFVSHLQKLPLSFYDRNATGDIMARATSDINAVRMAYGPGVMYFIDTITISIFSLIMMVNISWKLTLAAFAIFPIVSLVVYIIGKKSHFYHNLLQESFSELNTFAQENISGVRVVKAFALEKSHTDKFRRRSEDYFAKNMDLVKIQAIFIPMLYFLLGIGILLIIWLGGVNIIEGKMTLGGFAAFISYLMMLAWPMVAMGWVVNVFQRAEASMKRIDKIMSLKPDIVDPPESVKLPKFEPRIEFRNLDFSYDGNEPVLKNISLTIEPGSSLGIVGSVGSGKSALIKLIPRLYNPPPETVFVSGIPVEKITLEYLRSKIAFIPQEAFLFSETIQDNIDFSGVIDKNLFQEICQTAELDKDVVEFPQGYDTVVGERGITLSGGQKQRVSLARGLLKDASIIIIDDALTGVDASTEVEILENLKRVFAPKTVLVVTHRISAVMNMENIIVMEEGRIAESGDHRSLTKKRGLYFRLYRKQLLEEELEII